MARIAPLRTKDANWLMRLLYWFARREFGAVPEPLTVTAHHPRLLMASARHELAVKKAAKSPLGELVVYRTAVQLGCTWCIDFGEMLLKHEGLDIDRLKEIDDYATSPKFTEVERLALAYADAMTATPTTVTDEQVAELERRLGRRQVIELTYLVALENSRARFNNAFGITDQGFTSGEACRVPQP